MPPYISGDSSLVYLKFRVLLCSWVHCSGGCCSAKQNESRSVNDDPWHSPSRKAAQGLKGRNMTAKGNALGLMP
jgi:hypothetical protein